MFRKIYYVYILTNKRNTTLYIGVTNNLEHRVFEHRNKSVKSFTSKYNINKLVYCEEFDYVEDAIYREKQLKAGSRKNKIDLISGVNKLWNDLSDRWGQ